jgi:hypothetical protein
LVETASESVVVLAIKGLCAEHPLIISEIDAAAARQFRISPVLIVDLPVLR